MVGLVLQQDAHENFGTALDARLEREIRVPPFLDRAKTARNQFQGIHVYRGEHLAEFGVPAPRKPKESARVGGNRVNIAEEWIMLAVFCIYSR